MTELFSPILLYTGCAIGAVGVCLALPRRGTNPQVLGALIAAIAFGAIMLALALRAGGNLPGIMFYVFSLIALGSALRVVSHPRPVYAALYFVLTILASSGLYLLLGAEFMAFALIIVYAGAILITYLFVIMLATETPTAEEVEALSEYDRYSREPVFATVMGFIVVAALTVMIGRGLAPMQSPTRYEPGRYLADLPGHVETSLQEHGELGPGERLWRDESGNPRIDTRERTAEIVSAEGQTRTIPLPADVQLSNTEGVAFALLREHPGAIEMAGVVLLMAMLGAVVLARKKVEMDERAREAAAARQLTGSGGVA